MCEDRCSWLINTSPCGFEWTSQWKIGIKYSNSISVRETDSIKIDLSSGILDSVNVLIQNTDAYWTVHVLPRLWWILPSTFWSQRFHIHLHDSATLLSKLLFKGVCLDFIHVLLSILYYIEVQLRPSSKQSDSKFSVKWLHANHTNVYNAVP